jgi:hypothetical protein
MQKVFRIIKRKRNLRRLSAVWLCLVILELFCPVICEQPNSATLINSANTGIIASLESKSDFDETSISTLEQSTDNSKQNNCDECLCHANPIISFNFVNLKDSFDKDEQIAFSYGELVINSLPPPFQPPKNS